MNKKAVKFYIKDGQIKSEFTSNQTDVEEDNGLNRVTFALSILDSDGKIVASENFKATMTLNDEDPINYGNNEKIKNIICDVVRDQIIIDLNRCQIVENLVNAILDKR